MFVITKIMKNKSIAKSIGSELMMLGSSNRKNPWANHVAFSTRKAQNTTNKHVLLFSVCKI